MPRHTKLAVQEKAFQALTDLWVSQIDARKAIADRLAALQLPADLQHHPSIAIQAIEAAAIQAATAGRKQMRR